MKHLKTFEYFGYGQPQESPMEEEEMIQPFMPEEEEEGHEFEEEGEDEEFEKDDDYYFQEEEEEMFGEKPETSRIASFVKFSPNETTQESNCPSCNCQECECGGSPRMETYESKKSKPDFLDLDKDGNKKESMKKAAADKKKGSDDKSKKEDKKEPKKGGKLSKAQEKLPPALKKAIASGVRD